MRTFYWQADGRASMSQVEFELAYRRLAPRLERLVARAVTAPGTVVEEACQVAWSRLVTADPPVARGAIFSWLARTAIREAVRTVIARRRELSLDAESEDGEVIELPAWAPGPEDVAELRDRLGEVHRLPAREQRMVWLHGFGYRYAEIAEETGESQRAVERQLLRAKRSLGIRAA